MKRSKCKKIRAGERAACCPDRQESGMTERTYRIGEAARLLELEGYVLRFWETEFPRLRPVRTPKGQRLYSEADLDLLRRIRFLLHEQGMTIEGARRILDGYPELSSLPEQELGTPVVSPVGQPSDMARSEHVSNVAPLVNPGTAPGVASDVPSGVKPESNSSSRGLREALSFVESELLLLKTLLQNPN